IEDLIHPLDLKNLRGRVLSEKSINKSLEVRVKNKDGKYIWFEDICIPSYDDKGNLTLIKGISRCIQERKLAQNELERLIYSDSMTKLNNRKYFEDSIKKLKSKNLGIIVIDLDNLKEINDNFGHLIGDELILCAANILKRIFKEDIKVRIGGDEFIIVIKDANLELIKQKINELEEEIERYNNCSILKVSLSKGYSLYDSDNDNIRGSIEEADYNMYREKRKKKSLECEKKCMRNLKYSLDWE
ncbi:MAG: sensor domain-containing diguanylate cyclase, partial [Clostridium sp.]